MTARSLDGGGRSSRSRPRCGNTAPSHRQDYARWPRRQPAPCFPSTCARLAQKESVQCPEVRTSRSASSCPFGLREMRYKLGQTKSSDPLRSTTANRQPSYRGRFHDNGSPPATAHQAATLLCGLGCDSRCACNWSHAAGGSMAWRFFRLIRLADRVERSTAQTGRARLQERQ